MKETYHLAQEKFGAIDCSHSTGTSIEMAECLGKCRNIANGPNNTNFDQKKILLSHGAFQNSHSGNFESLFLVSRDFLDGIDRVLKATVENWNSLDKQNISLNLLMFNSLIYCLQLKNVL